MEQTVVDIQSLLVKESFVLGEAQELARLAQNSKAQRDTLEQWLCDQADQLSRARGDVGQEALKLGLLLASAGRPDKAIDWLLKAPAGPDRSLSLGLCYLQTHKFEPALAELDTAKASGTDAFTVAMAKVEALRQLGRLEEAENLLKQHEPDASARRGRAEPSVDGSRTKADYWYQLGRICEDRGQKDEALTHYEQCLQMQEDHQGAHFRLAYYSDLAGDDESALEHYRQCVSVWPVHVNALLNLAVLYEDAEDYDKAEACLRKILSANPNHERAKLFLRDVLSTKTMYYDEDQERRQDRRNQVLEIPVTDFELSVRSRNCLKSMGLNNLGDLLKVTEQDLLRYKNFGETSLREVRAILSQKGLRLGQMVEDQSGKHAGAQADSEDSDTVSAGAMNIPLPEVNFSVRVKRCLEGLGVTTLGDVAELSQEKLLTCKNFGQTSLDEVKSRLRDHGLSLADS
ncbi:MAG: tetratricopeptide repeat protein [Actinobacteria bacterium]|nr:tetratricopeptide repeat protein [Actinomycetota bacterium]